MPEQDAPPPPAPQRRMGKLGARTALPVLLLVVGFLGGISLFSLLQDDEEPPERADLGPAIATAVGRALDKPAVSREVYQAILPSLVFIRTTNGQGSSGLGSGVIVNDTGLILTANHVIEGARTITVTFADGTESAAAVMSADAGNDIAVLTPELLPEVVVPAVLAGSEGLEVGDEAFAVGNPLGLAASITAGVVSGLNRQITKQDGSGTLSGLIQFDAAVNPGSSGGPLLNREGQVIGIVTALANPSKQDTFTGIGFAVPLEAAGGAGGGPPR